jgi:hypothetical protein
VFYIETAESTCTESVLAFLPNLKRQVVPELMALRPYVFFDLHGSHLSYDVHTLAIWLGFRPFYLPQAACMFNAIEYFWNGFKRIFNMLLAE